MVNAGFAQSASAFLPRTVVPAIMFRDLPRDMDIRLTSSAKHGGAHDRPGWISTNWRARANA